MLLENSVKQDTTEITFCGARNDIDELKLEQGILSHEYRSFDVKFDYFQKLVKPEVNVISQGQKTDLLKLSTEG
jgi:hypothetical protein